MPSLTAVTVCLWMKTADTGNEGSLLSYAVSGRDNELLLLDYRNFLLNVGDDGDRYKHVQAWHSHFYLHLSLHWVQLNTVRYIQDFFSGKSVSDDPWSTRCSCPDYPNFEEQEWHSGENACLPPMWPGFDLGLIPYVGCVPKLWHWKQITNELKSECFSYTIIMWLCLCQIHQFDWLKSILKAV